MSYRTFDVRRIAGALGAEVSGVDLGEPLDDASSRDFDCSPHGKASLMRTVGITGR